MKTYNYISRARRINFANRKRPATHVAKVIAEEYRNIHKAIAAPLQ